MNAVDREAVGALLRFAARCIDPDDPKFGKRLAEFEPSDDLKFRQTLTESRSARARLRLAASDGELTAAGRRIVNARRAARARWSR